MFREFNFDGLVGPTHNYAGLSHGNLASARNQGLVASPKTAALEGLAKMRFVASLGIGQAVLPPLPRPNLKLLRSLGFFGSPAQLIAAADKADPTLVAISYSASSMWTANAATVSPSPDTADRRLHLTPANLNSLLHRSLEAQQTTAVLRQIFADPNYFQVHSPLPFGSALADEGAANHTRLAADHGAPGVEWFTFGRSALDPNLPSPAKFPARQTREACQAIARRHQLAKSRTLVTQQHPEAIDAGVFHNDVIAVGSVNLLLAHERAFVDQPRVIADLREMWSQTQIGPLHYVEISSAELSLADAVSSYLFNSQLLKTNDGTFVIVCPRECEATPAAHCVLQRLLVDPAIPIAQVKFLNLRQSMRNGGGPACLRLRVVLSDEQQQAALPGVFWSDDLDRRLTAWIQRHYRDELAPDDLCDPHLINESFQALDELGKILGIDLCRIIEV